MKERGMRLAGIEDRRELDDRLRVFKSTSPPISSALPLPPQEKCPNESQSIALPLSEQSSCGVDRR